MACFFLDFFEGVEMPCFKGFIEEMRCKLRISCEVYFSIQPFNPSKVSWDISITFNVFSNEFSVG